MSMPNDPTLTEMPVKIMNWPPSKPKDCKTIPKTVTLTPGDTDAFIVVPHSAKRRCVTLVFSGAKGVAIAATSFGWIGVSKSDAQKQVGALVTAGMAPFTIYGTTELWAMIDPTATTPVTISVFADIDAEN
jgi:hypothetical protein